MCDHCSVFFAQPYHLDLIEPMDTLIIESYFCTPHLETAGEIAITEVMSGKKVGFCFIYSDDLI
ncbi:hypothetical protein BCV63_10245 [Cylindrospermopsis raciborskii CS-508]|nr:hypothetical protein BCV63_10245 [Cylindrospermopsis raciborskii CS-508]